eukprot:TRINITY_DN1430_c0_g1_i1.p1 TRINITY_DN1430_c0_g1~~TRINITY_DN1430_c0_g1_i1.p1  ORF type:complete len:225 (+),score=30.22 TRINITY_DN1430_c0_g1_i1:552-1226(+)
MLKSLITKKQDKNSSLLVKVEKGKETVEEQRLYPEALEELRKLRSSVSKLKESYYSMYEKIPESIPSKPKQLKAELAKFKNELEAIQTENGTEIRQLRQMVELTKNKLREQQLIKTTNAHKIKEYNRAIIAINKRSNDPRILPHVASTCKKILIKGLLQCKYSTSIPARSQSTIKSGTVEILKDNRGRNKSALGDKEAERPVLNKRALRLLQEKLLKHTYNIKS